MYKTSNRRVTKNVRVKMVISKSTAKIATHVKLFRNYFERVEIYEDLTSLKQPLEKKPTKREEGLTNVPTIRHHPKEAEVRSSPTSSASTVRPGPLAIRSPYPTRSLLALWRARFVPVKSETSVPCILVLSS